MSATSRGEVLCSRKTLQRSLGRYSKRILHTFKAKAVTYSCKPLPIVSYVIANGVSRYVIPGKDGTLEPGKRLLNFVWYCNYPENSKEFDDLMTDNLGQRHRITLPAGKIRPEIWTRQKELAKSSLPAAFADLIAKASQPFVQAITDVISPQASAFDGKLVFVGDALAGFRPHVASSAAQAAFDAQLLAKVFKGELAMSEWEKQVLDFAQRTSQQGIAMGKKNQFQQISQLTGSEK